MLQRCALILAIFVLSFSTSATELKYPNLSGVGRSSLGLAVLNLALRKSGEDYHITVDARRTTPKRALYMLESGEIDVIDGGYLPSVLDKVSIIYLPLEMGLSGWRLFVIHKDTETRLSQVKTVDDLKLFTFGQGQGWHDAKVLENAGFTVFTAPKIVNLISMVKVKRFDLFPLGANEAYHLLDVFGQQGDSLIVDDSVVLVYPFGRFFYVRKDNKALKKAIETGMEKALADGSLLTLLKNHPFFKDAFEKAHLNTRTRINIETPGLTEEFKAIDPKWWYTP